MSTIVTCPSPWSLGIGPSVQGHLFVRVDKAGCQGYLAYPCAHVALNLSHTHAHKEKRGGKGEKPSSRLYTDRVDGWFVGDWGLERQRQSRQWHAKHALGEQTR